MRWMAGRLLGLAVASAIVGCEIVAGLDHNVSLTAAAGSGGGSASTRDATTTTTTTTSGGGAASTSTSSASMDSGAGGGNPCGVTFPSMPSNADAGGNLSFTTAFHTINLGDQGVVGLDLDLTCSCHGKGASCIEPLLHCDDSQGRDNSAGGIFGLLTFALRSEVFSSAAFTKQAEDGNWTILIRVKDYNGTANDAQVEFDWYLSTGFDTTSTAKPRWNGSDVWKVTSSSVNGASLDNPLYLDKHAYVSNNILVTSMTETPIPLRIGNLGHVSFTLSNAGMLARIQYNPALKTYRLVDGQMVGRLKLTEMFKTMSSYRDIDGRPLCTNADFYKAAKANFCLSADILANGGTPTVPCDAISFAVGFTADPVVLGKVDATVPPSTPGCPHATDPANDTCPQ
jgi:hypothetical protein